MTCIAPARYCTHWPQMPFQAFAYQPVVPTAWAATKLPYGSRGFLFGEHANTLSDGGASLVGAIHEDAQRTPLKQLSYEGDVFGQRAEAFSDRRENTLAATRGTKEDTRAPPLHCRYQQPSQE
jgi:hypothetical protein